MIADPCVVRPRRHAMSSSTDGTKPLELLGQARPPGIPVHCHREASCAAWPRFHRAFDRRRPRDQLEHACLLAGRAAQPSEGMCFCLSAQHSDEKRKGRLP